MARRKRQQNISIVRVLGAALGVYVLYQIVAQNFPLFTSLAVVVGLVATIAFVLPPRLNRRIVFNKASAVIEQHSGQLAKSRAQLVRQDAYGKPQLDKWHAEINYFIREHIRPRLSVKQQFILQREHSEIARLIMLRADAHTEQSPVFEAFSESMTPMEFESSCAEQLRECGWDARLTRTTGDQGVDIIAEKNGLRVVLQCKLYSKSVDNSAVQQIVAGMAYERAHRCAVVTNNRYTRSAEQLAATNRVLLLHYSDLPNLEVMLKRRFPESWAHAYTPDLFATTPDVDTPAPTVEAVQDELPLPAEPSRFLDKRVWIIGGVLLVLVIATTLLPKRVQQQKSVTSDNHAKTAASSRKRQTAPEFTTYSDSNFGFRIAYPASFVTKDTVEDGKGITLTAPDGEAGLVVAGANTNGLTLNDLYDNSLKDVTGELGYHRVGGNWFVLTWKDGGRVFYRKTFVGVGSQNTFIFAFPESQRPTYESITTRIEKSFTPGALDEAR